MAGANCIPPEFIGIKLFCLFLIFYIVENLRELVLFTSVIIPSQAESTMSDILHCDIASRIPDQCGIPHLAGQALTLRTVQNHLKERLDGHQSK